LTLKNLETYTRHASLYTLEKLIIVAILSLLLYFTILPYSICYIFPAKKNYSRNQEPKVTKKAPTEKKERSKTNSPPIYVLIAATIFVQKTCKFFIAIDVPLAIFDYKNHGIIITKYKSEKTIFIVLTSLIKPLEHFVPGKASVI